LIPPFTQFGKFDSTFYSENIENNIFITYIEEFKKKVIFLFHLNFIPVLVTILMILQRYVL